MWPALSITKPEPSACWLWLWGTEKPKNGSIAGVLTTCVAVTWTTPGAARRLISLTDSALPLWNAVGLAVAGSGCSSRTVVVVDLKGPSPGPAPEPTAPPITADTTSAASARGERAATRPVITRPYSAPVARD